MSTAPEPAGRPGSGGAPGALRIRLDALQPFADDPERPITFSDLQAAFGMGLYSTRKAIHLLRQAQLLDRRRSGRPPKHEYLLPRMTVTLLGPNKVSRLSRAKALQCVNAGLDVVAAHNAAHRLSRVIAFSVMGTLHDPGVQVHQFVEVEVTVAVVPEGTLVQDIDQLVRDLRRIGDRALRISLVMELRGALR
jgi:hypothetical protein